MLVGRNSSRRRLNRPSGAAFLPDRRLIIADTEHNRLLVFDSDGRLLQEVDKLPGGAKRPSMLSVGTFTGADGKMKTKLIVGCYGGLRTASGRDAPGVLVLDVEEDGDVLMDE